MPQQQGAQARNREQILQNVATSIDERSEGRMRKARERALDAITLKPTDAQAADEAEIEARSHVAAAEALTEAAEFIRENAARQAP